MNTVCIIGNMVKAPELKTTNSGIMVTSFSVAVARPSNREKTDFINVVAWRQTAEFVCKYFSKGQKIAIEGELQSREYEDKNGAKRFTFEVNANNVFFCQPKESRPETKGSIDLNNDDEWDLSEGDDELPF